MSSSKRTNGKSDAAQAQIIGRRSEQQDRSALVQIEVDGRRALLILVADGMGGAIGGAKASRLAIEAAEQRFATDATASVSRRLKNALEAANNAIAQAVSRDRGLDGMGTTFIGAVVTGRNVTWISVGDSLLFTVRGTTLSRLNADHSLASVLDDAARRGEITVQEAATSPQRNMLRSALTGGAVALVDEGSTTLAPGSRLVAATDGIFTLKNARIAAIVGGAETMNGAIRSLLDAIEANMPSDQDNVTIAGVTVTGSGGKAAPSMLLLLSLASLLLLIVLGGLAVFYQRGMGAALETSNTTTNSVAPPVAAPDAANTATTGTPDNGDDDNIGKPKHHGGIDPNNIVAAPQPGQHVIIDVVDPHAKPQPAPVAPQHMTPNKGPAQTTTTPAKPATTSKGPLRPAPDAPPPHHGTAGPNNE